MNSRTSRLNRDKLHIRAVQPEIIKPRAIYCMVLKNRVLPETEDLIICPLSDNYVRKRTVMGLITALATVLIQTWKASNINPVETLKYE